MGRQWRHDCRKEEEKTTEETMKTTKKTDDGENCREGEQTAKTSVERANGRQKQACRE